MSKITVSWTSYAKLSYFEELDFIQLKWTLKEVNAFIRLVDKLIENLSTGVIQGKKTFTINCIFDSYFKANNGIL